MRPTYPRATLPSILNDNPLVPAPLHSINELPVRTHDPVPALPKPVDNTCISRRAPITNPQSPLSPSLDTTPSDPATEIFLSKLAWSLLSLFQRDQHLSHTDRQHVWNTIVRHVAMDLRLQDPNGMARLRAKMEEVDARHPGEFGEGWKDMVGAEGGLKLWTDDRRAVGEHMDGSGMGGKGGKGRGYGKRRKSVCKGSGSGRVGLQSHFRLLRVPPVVKGESNLLRRRGLGESRLRVKVDYPREQPFVDYDGDVIMGSSW